MRILYKNVIITDKNGSRPGEVLTENSKIKTVYTGKRRSRAKRDVEVDGGGKNLMPGFIDLHSHLRDPGLTYKEDIESGLAAAAKGGFTTVCAMANTVPPVNTPEAVLENTRKADALGGAELIQAATLTTDGAINDLEELEKVTRLISDDGKNVDDAGIMREALQRLKELELVLATHNEPEVENIKRDLKLLRENGGRLHLCHVSTKDSVDLIRQAKKEGLNVTSEVTPHHLYASSLQYKVNPPFGTSSDKMALIKAVKEGIIDALATDHAPHSEEDKKNGAPGIDGFETAFGLLNKVFSQNHIPLERLSEMISYTPARILGLEAGLIESGMPADLVLVDPEAEWKIRAKDFISKSHNTPFDGEWVKGKVLRTIKEGKTIYEDDNG